MLDKLLAKGECRQQEMIRMEDFDRELSQEEEPHNDGFNSQEDNRLRKSQTEMYYQAQARRELQATAYGGNQAESRASTRQGTDFLGGQCHTGRKEAPLVGTGCPPTCITPKLVATTKASLRQSWQIGNCRWSSRGGKEAAAHCKEEQRPGLPQTLVSGGASGKNWPGHRTQKGDHHLESLSPVEQDDRDQSKDTLDGATQRKILYPAALPEGP